MSARKPISPALIAINSRIVVDSPGTGQRDLAAARWPPEPPRRHGLHVLRQRRGRAAGAALGIGLDGASGVAARAGAVVRFLLGRAAPGHGHPGPRLRRRCFGCAAARV